MWDKEVDVLCVGSGAGGLAAAITAGEQKASVLLVEKDTKVGGVTGISSGQCWIGGTHLEENADIADSAAETLEYLEHLSQGHADPAMREVFVNKSIDVIRYLTDTIGIRLVVVRNYPDYYYPLVKGSKAEGRYLEVEPFAAAQLGEWADRSIITSYGNGYAYVMTNEVTAMLGGTGPSVFECLENHLAKDERCAGAGLVAAMLQAALQRGVEVWTHSGATKLISDETGVIGAIVATPQGDKRVRARKGVILATGGYDWNDKLVRSYETLPEFGSMCPPTVTGDHLVMAAEVGALPLASRAPAQTPIFIGYKVPHEKIYDKPSYRMYIPGNPHSILVNRAGNRFCDDGFYPDAATKVGRFDGQGAGNDQGMVNWPAWLVFDDSFREKYNLLPNYPGQPVPEDAAQQADSIEQLAGITGIDAAGLRATVQRFNGFCETGIDTDFARGTVPWGRIMAGDPRQPHNNPNLGPIESGPFYAVKLERVVMGVPTVGLEIDAHARVINSRGEPIKGLYAAGNSASWTDIGGGYNSGIANTRGLVFGHLAARDMLK
ncbi:MAG: hypothetical protein JWM78_474 [Verrucomicrobiaceae bacterium]|nr:hypothetical protein [Verrucomicrobiaceae bacterium]